MPTIIDQFGETLHNDHKLGILRDTLRNVRISNGSVSILTAADDRSPFDAILVGRLSPVSVVRAFYEARIGLR